MFLSFESVYGWIMWSLCQIFIKRNIGLVLYDSLIISKILCTFALYIAQLKYKLTYTVNDYET